MTFSEQLKNLKVTAAKRPVSFWCVTSLCFVKVR